MATHRKKINYKTKKRNAVVPRTDANQNVRERAERKARQQQYIINKFAQYQARQMMADNSTAGKMIDGLS
jgi:hypothetical protein